MNYKSFESDNFRQDLKKELLKFDITNAPLSNFNDAVLSVHDKDALKKWNIYVQTIAALWLKNWEKQLWTDKN